MTTRYDELLKQVQKFHVEHPEVWTLFSKFTLDRIQAGFLHYSVNGIFERIRWETAEAKGEPFKLNNNFRPFYARKFMNAHPQHQGFFRTREQISKAKPPVKRAPLTPEYFDHSTSAGIQGG